MQDITELQRRISAALDRIGAGIDKLDHADAVPTEPVADTAGDLAGLTEELEAERALSAQLEERLQANRLRSDQIRAEAEAEVANLAARLSELEEDRSRLKAVNDALRSSNEALRAANEAGQGDGALVDSALRTELDALRQVRASDRAELDAIVSLLGPALDETDSEEAPQDA